MTNVKVNLPPRLIDSARAAQYANRDTLDRRELASKVQQKVRTDATREVKKFDPMATKKGPEGGQLEFESRKKPRLWTKRRLVEDGDGFLLVPSSPAEGEFIALLTGSRWRLAQYANLGDTKAVEEQPGSTFPGFEVSGDPKKLFASITQNDKLVSTGPDGEIYAPYQNTSSVWNAAYGILSFATSLDTNPGYNSSRKYGYLYHAAINELPPQGSGLKPGQRPNLRYETPSIGEDDSTQNTKTPYENSNYNLCTFEVIVSLGSTPGKGDPILGPVVSLDLPPTHVDGALYVRRVIGYVDYDEFGNITGYVRTVPDTNPVVNSIYANYTYRYRAGIAIMIGGISIDFVYDSIASIAQPQKWQCGFGSIGKSKSLQYNQSMPILLDGEKEYHFAIVYRQDVVDLFLAGKKVASGTCPIADRNVDVQQFGALGSSLVFTNKMVSRSPAIPVYKVDYYESLNNNIVAPDPPVLVDTITERLITTREATDECKVGFHGFRFTPQKALYGSQPPDPSTGLSFTPPTRITKLA